MNFKTKFETVICGHEKNGGKPKRSWVDCKLQAVMDRKCEKMNNKSNKVIKFHEKHCIIQNEHQSENKLIYWVYAAYYYKLLSGRVLQQVTNKNNRKKSIEGYVLDLRLSKNVCFKIEKIKIITSI